ncbi:MAG: hypothetical protein ACK56I_03690, partial [bacterium]
MAGATAVPSSPSRCTTPIRVLTALACITGSREPPSDIARAPITSASRSSEASSFTGTFPFIWVVAFTRPCFCWATCQASCGRCLSWPGATCISVP